MHVPKLMSVSTEPGFVINSINILVDCEVTVTEENTISSLLLSWQK
jgi:hypothetical protein